MRWTRAVRVTNVLTRTAKSCRSDAPMLASSLREEAQATVSNKPGHRGEREVSRKTIARGMPGETGVTVVTTLVCLFYFACEAAGASSARHSLRPLIFRADGFLQELGRIAPRGRGRMLVVIARSAATKQSRSRHSGAMRSIEPGISRFPDVQLHI